MNNSPDLTVQKHQHVIYVLNKIDLKNNTAEAFENKYRDQLSVKISAKTGEGFDSLKKQLIHLVMNEKEISVDYIISKVRHRDALVRIKEYLLNAQQSIKNQMSPEFIALDLRGALNAIGEITGEVTSDDILNDIFSKFCIGK